MPMLRDVQSQPSDSAIAAAHSTLHGALEDVSARLDEVVESAGPARPIMEHLISKRGKLLRPRLVLLSSAIVAGDEVFSPALAAAAELIHSASLLHDDVIDAGDQRRGLPAARVIYSNAASVLAGDHCLTDAMDLIRSVDPGVALAEALACVRQLVDGELIQLETRGRLVLDEAHYRRVCELKTASLFVWAARAGARFGGGSQDEIDRFGEFASDLGIAFQIRDDLLDFVGGERFGKELHEDLREARSTLPVILASAENPTIVAELEKLDRSAPNDVFELGIGRVAKLVRETRALEAVTNEVQERMQRALQRLDDFGASPFRDLLIAQINSLG
jgi:octaprenyl-diphosphate synthase